MTLRLATAALALLFGAKVVLKAALHGDPVAGYPSLMAVVLFLGGVQLTTLGVIGEYLGRVFNEAKGRPIYIPERYLPPAQAGGDPGQASSDACRLAADAQGGCATGGAADQASPAGR